METSDYPYRFDFSSEKDWKGYLAEHGFVVVGNVIPSEVCDKSLQEMRETLCQFSSSLNLQNALSWSLAKNYPFMLHGGMVQYVGHSKFQWNLRELSAPVFAKAWDCLSTELATSFDGFCYMDGKRNYREKELLGFVHTDQSPTRDGFWGFQGLANLCDNGEDDGGFVVVPDTHKVHKDFFQKIGKSDHKDDWYKFTDDDKKDEVFNRGLKVCAKKGDFILWDSRTFHCNTVPTSMRIRACVYICQVPKEKVTTEVREKRKKAWEERRTTSHAPGEGFRAFPKVPHHGDNSIKQIVPKVSIEDKDITPLQKSVKTQVV